jgi:hypothetical protein
MKKKIEEWIESITDEAVQNAVKRDTIVTGGSIASMLLGEKVNDFDVYFKTKATTKIVAEYYVKKFNEKKKTDNGGIEYTPYVKEETMQNIKKQSEDRVVIYMKSAGIAAEGQTPYQYFESRTEEEVAEFAESLITDEAVEGDKYRPVFLSQNAITLSSKMQIVIRFYGEPTQIHNNYDFAHAMCYYVYDSNELVLPAEALECLLSRTLVYRGSLYPIASIFRTKKFLDRGWRITAGQLLKIMWQISEIDMTDHAILREQLTGVDQAYMFQLIEALKSVDPEKINSTYIAEIIDRIFD